MKKWLVLVTVFFGLNLLVVPQIQAEEGGSLDDTVLAETSGDEGSLDTDVEHEKEIRGLEATITRMERENRISGISLPDWSLISGTAEIVSRQHEGDGSKRDNVQVGRVRWTPSAKIDNFIRGAGLKVLAVVNVEGRINNRIDNRDPDKPKDDALDKGLTFRPSKAVVQELILQLQGHREINGEEVAFVLELGRGELHNGNFPNSEFLDYSNLEGFKADQTEFIGVGYVTKSGTDLRIEFFDLNSSEGGNFGKSFNVYGETKLTLPEGSPLVGGREVLAYISGTHNEPGYDNPNDLVELSEDQNQYSAGLEFDSENLGKVKMQYIYRENDQSKDDQGFTVTFDKDVSELIAENWHALVKYDYLDAQGPQLGKHQISIGGKKLILDSDSFGKFSWTTEVFQTSDGNSPIGGSGDEQTGAQTGVRWDF